MMSITLIFQLLWRLLVSYPITASHFSRWCEIYSKVLAALLGYLRALLKPREERARRPLTNYKDQPILLYY